MGRTPVSARGLHSSGRVYSSSARAIIAELSDEMKELLRNELFAEADLSRRVEVETVEDTPVEECNADEEDFTNSQ